MGFRLTSTPPDNWVMPAAETTRSKRLQSLHESVTCKAAALWALQGSNPTQQASEPCSAPAPAGWEGGKPQTPATPCNSSPHHESCVVDRRLLANAVHAPHAHAGPAQHAFTEQLHGQACTRWRCVAAARWRARDGPRQRSGHVAEEQRRLMQPPTMCKRALRQPPSRNA